MSESYTVGGDAFRKLDFPNQGGQTFIPKETHELRWIDLNLKNLHRNVNPFIEVWHCDIDHQPIGSRLSTNMWRTEDPEIAPNVERARFPMQPYVLSKGSYYVITVYRGGAAWLPDPEWEYQTAGATYPRGHRISRDSFLDPWTVHPGSDHMFIEWGLPPVPKPEPTPLVTKITPLNVEYFGTCTGMKIRYTTDSPSHQYLYWTDKQPRKHKRPRMRRGEPWVDILAYCFVAWNVVEQEELGDTLYHTFFVEPWENHTTRWYTFRGKIDTQFSPSAAPIFRLRRNVAGVLFAGTLSNRTIFKSHAIWDTCHDSPDGTILANYAAPFYRIIAGERLVATYGAFRGFLFFDTSEITPEMKIGEANLNLWVLEAMRTSSNIYPNLCITQGVQHDPVITTDYGAQLPITEIGGQKDFASLIVGQYNAIPFNEDGLEYITPGGITKLCLRGEQNVVDNPPPLGTNWVHFRSAQKGAPWIPLLQVCYHTD